VCGTPEATSESQSPVQEPGNQAYSKGNGYS